MKRETSRTIAAWAEETFGPAQPEALVDRAAIELEELAESLASADAKAITSEAADVAILLHAWRIFTAGTLRRPSMPRWRATARGSGNAAVTGRVVT